MMHTNVYCSCAGFTFIAAEEHILKWDHTNAPFAVFGASMTSRALVVAQKYSVMNLLNEKEICSRSIANEKADLLIAEAKKGDDRKVISCISTKELSYLEEVQQRTMLGVKKAHSMASCRRHVCGLTTSSVRVHLCSHTTSHEQFPCKRSEMVDILLL